MKITIRHGLMALLVGSLASGICFELAAGDDYNRLTGPNYSYSGSFGGPQSSVYGGPQPMRVSTPSFSPEEDPLRARIWSSSPEKSTGMGLHERMMRAAGKW